METTFTCTDDGSFTLTLTTDDGINPPVSASTTVTVSNVAPAITDAMATLDQAQATISVAAADPGENDTLGYAFDCDNDGGYELDAGAMPSASCPFIQQQEGVFTFGVQVSDGDGGITTEAVTVTVATELCSSNLTGLLRYSADCQDHETAITLPDDIPLTVCASTLNGLLRAPATGVCADHETAYVLPEDGPLSVCINTYTWTMRLVDDLSRCTSHEFGRVIAATEIVALPPARTR